MVREFTPSNMLGNVKSLKGYDSSLMRPEITAAKQEQVNYLVKMSIRLLGRGLMFVSISKRFTLNIGGHLQCC